MPITNEFTVRFSTMAIICGSIFVLGVIIGLLL